MSPRRRRTSYRLTEAETVLAAALVFLVGVLFGIELLGSRTARDAGIAQAGLTPVHLLPAAPEGPSVPTVVLPLDAVAAPRGRPFVLYPVETKQDLEASLMTVGPAPAALGLRPAIAGEDLRPLVAVVIDDLGIDAEATADAISLPADVTLSFMSYGAHSPAMSAEAAASGHLLLMHIPMEPLGTDDPGPRALRVSSASTMGDLIWHLSRFGGYVGVNNHMGSRFTRDEGALVPVLTEIGERGLLFLDSRTVNDSIAGDVARALGLDAVDRDVFLDDDPAPGQIDGRLAALVAHAKRNGTAIAIGHPRAATLDAVRRWTTTLDALGVRLAPIDEVAERRRSSVAAVAAR